MNLMYEVVPPLLMYDRRLALTGTEATAYQVEITSQLPARSNWSVLTNIMLIGGTNWIPDTLPESHSNRFYRAKWLPDR